MHCGGLQNIASPSEWLWSLNFSREDNLLPTLLLYMWLLSYSERYQSILHHHYIKYVSIFPCFSMYFWSHFFSLPRPNSLYSNCPQLSELAVSPRKSSCHCDGQRGALNPWEVPAPTFPCQPCCLDLPSGLLPGEAAALWGSECLSPRVALLCAAVSAP